MDSFIQYWYLFIDSMMAALLLPIHEELAIDILLTFNTHNKFLILIFSLLGGTIGSMINYYAGILLAKGRELVYNEHISKSESRKVYLLLQKYGYLFIPLSFIKLIGGMISFTAGFCNLNPVITMLLIIIGRLIHYITKIFFSF